MKTHTIPAVIVLAVGIMFTSAKLRSQVIYSEQFLNTKPLPSENMYLANFGWAGYINSMATVVNAGNAYIPNLAGNPAPGKGYLTLSGISATYGLIETFSAIDAAGSEITWNMGNSSTSTTVRLLVQSGSDWYASSQLFSNTTAYASQSAFSAATTSDVLQSLTFSTAADNWMSFTLNPKTEMTLGSISGSDLSSSQITGIGFYVTTTSGTTRLDSLVVTAAAVPEPSAYAAVLGAVALVSVGCRRKRPGVERIK